MTLRDLNNSTCLHIALCDHTTVDFSSFPKLRKSTPQDLDEAPTVAKVSLAFLGLFFMAYQNLVGRCLVCKHGSHVIKIPKADWSSVKNKQLTATPC